MQRFKKITLVSYYLMIPYLLWCFYALILNLSLFILN
jgi:benzodiazapine receptor